MVGLQLHRQGIALGCMLMLFGAVSGCQESPSEDFQTYDRVSGENNSTDTPAKSPPAGNSDPSPASQIVGTTPGSPKAPFSVETLKRKPLEAPRPDEVAIIPNDPSSSVTRSDTPAGSKEPLEVKLLIPHKTFETVGPEDAIRVSFDDIDLLKVLNMEPVTADAPELLPDWLQSLDGQRIRIRGFMFPPFQETGIKSFFIARDNEICCFGRDPKVYDKFNVFMRKGVTTNYINGRPFDVVGVFRITPWIVDGKLLQIYKIEDAVILQR